MVVLAETLKTSCVVGHPRSTHALRISSRVRSKATDSAKREACASRHGSPNFGQAFRGYCDSAGFAPLISRYRRMWVWIASQIALRSKSRLRSSVLVMCFPARAAECSKTIIKTEISTTTARRIVVGDGCAIVLPLVLTYRAADATINCIICPLFANHALSIPSFYRNS